MSTHQPSAMPAHSSASSSLSFSTFRQDPGVKPNPHPYAIRTTSTGLLSRSNSSGHNVTARRHHYIPLSPTRSKSDGKAHRHSKSLNSGFFTESRSPRPLPVPPGFKGSTRDRTNNTPSIGDQRIPRRLRAGTLPTPSTTDAQFSVTLEELPSNPKLWTASQLASYLPTSMRATAWSTASDSEQPPLALSVISDIVSCVKDVKMDGRMFLRLDDKDLESMGVNEEWREALLLASRNLRQNVIKGRIWGISDSPPSGSSSPSLPSHPFSSALYNSSTSSVDLTQSDTEADRPRRRRGLVRGMVESLERSGSFSSESSFDGDGFDRAEVIERWTIEEGPVDEEAVRSSSPEDSVPLASPMISTLEEEPSVEALLASESNDLDRTETWGARAWEEMDLAPGITVKRIEPNDGTLLDLGIKGTIIGLGHGKERTNSRRGKDKVERRVVTAIFTPSPIEQVNQEPIPVVEDSFADYQHGIQRISPFIPEEASEESHVRILALEEELVETRSLVEAFRTRLEAVERKLLESEETHVEREEIHRLSAITSSTTQKEIPQVRPEEQPSTTVDILESDPLTSFAQPVLSVLRATLVKQFTPSRAGHASEPIHHRKQDDDGSPAGPDEPSTLSDLPSYVFLVGIGVCAVVLQVMLKKMAGRSAGLNWRN